MKEATFISLLADDSERLKFRSELVEATLKNPPWVEILLTNMEAIDDVKVASFIYK